MAVWRQEFHHLPEADSSRLRRAQRLYVEEWVHVVHELRPDLDDASVRALVHGVLALLQSPSDFHSGLPDDGVVNLLHGPGPELVPAALAHRALAGVHFTGSTAVFQGIWSQVGENAGALAHGPLTADQVAEVDKLLDR